MVLAATKGLVNGWVLGVVMGALPGVLRAFQLGVPPFGTDLIGEDGCWLSVVALNLGVALVWAMAVATSPLADRILSISGYSLIALAWIPFLRQIWRPLTQ